VPFGKTLAGDTGGDAARVGREDAGNIAARAKRFSA